MREILFRGKRLSDGEWLFGDLQRNPYATLIFSPDGLGGFYRCFVDPATVGQFTGFNDKNGKKVFEGDILRVVRTSNGLGKHFKPGSGEMYFVEVIWSLCEWVWNVIGQGGYHLRFPEAWCFFEYEVIGNIHDKNDDSGNNPHKKK